MKVNSANTDALGIWEKKVIIAAIVILAALAVYRGYTFLDVYLQKRAQSDPRARVVNAPPGAAISNFPSELFLEKDVLIERSYSLEYDALNSSQQTLFYVSKFSISQNIANYENYFIKNGWLIIKRGQGFLYVAKNNYAKEASLVVTGAPQGSSVRISYFEKR